MQSAHTPAPLLELSDLSRFTHPLVTIPPTADHWLFFVGRDDVHGILKLLLKSVTSSLYLNMFGYDDDELNAHVLELLQEPAVTTLITLDKSQAGGVHERTLLATDAATDAAGYRASVVVGTSSTDQITHTKGGTIDGRISFEGSTNWSTSGEGTFLLGKPDAGGAGYKAQNNTLTVCSDAAETVARFTAELIAEHVAAAAQAARRL